MYASRERDDRVLARAWNSKMTGNVEQSAEQCAIALLFVAKSRHAIEMFEHNLEVPPLLKALEIATKNILNVDDLHPAVFLSGHYQLCMPLRDSGKQSEVATSK